LLGWHHAETFDFAGKRRNRRLFRSNLRWRSTATRKSAPTADRTSETRAQDFFKIQAGLSLHGAKAALSQSLGEAALAPGAKRPMKTVKWDFKRPAWAAEKTRTRVLPASLPCGSISAISIAAFVKGLPDERAIHRIGRLGTSVAGSRGSATASTLHEWPQSRPACVSPLRSHHRSLANPMPSLARIATNT